MGFIYVQIYLWSLLVLQVSYYIEYLIVTPIIWNHDYYYYYYYSQKFD